MGNQQGALQQGLEDARLSVANLNITLQQVISALNHNTTATNTNSVETSKVTSTTNTTTPTL